MRSDYADVNGIYDLEIEQEYIWHSLNKSSQEKLLRIYELSIVKEPTPELAKEYIALHVWALEANLDISIIPENKIKRPEKSSIGLNEKSNCANISHSEDIKQTLSNATKDFYAK